MKNLLSLFLALFMLLPLSATWAQPSTHLVRASSAEPESLDPQRVHTSVRDANRQRYVRWAGVARS